jgi:hypothetical protein
VSAYLSSQIRDVLPTTRDSYHKLVLVVGPARTGKTAALTELAAQHSWPRLNVNLHLSERLLELTHRQRAARIASILDDVIREEKSEVVLLDNLELLFSEDLSQDPLRLLQAISRNRTIVAAWPGRFDGGCLTYAEPGHPEARRYQTPQAVVVKAGDNDQSQAGAFGSEMI